MARADVQQPGRVVAGTRRRGHFCPHRSPNRGALLITAGKLRRSLPLARLRLEQPGRILAELCQRLGFGRALARKAEGG
jgi:hypothetical protein